MPSDNPLLAFKVPPDLLQRIDDYRFRHRYANRAEAIKRLIEFALAADPPRPDPAG